MPSCNRVCIRKTTTVVSDNFNNPKSKYHLTFQRVVFAVNDITTSSFN